MGMIKCARYKIERSVGLQAVIKDHELFLRRLAQIVMSMTPESNWSTNIETGFT